MHAFAEAAPSGGACHSWGNQIFISPAPSLHVCCAPLQRDWVVFLLAWEALLQMEKEACPVLAFHKGHVRYCLKRLLSEK